MNPYEAPKADLAHTPSLVPKGFRVEGKHLILLDREVILPQVCVKTGDTQNLVEQKKDIVSYGSLYLILAIIGIIVPVAFFAFSQHHFINGVLGIIFILTFLIYIIDATVWTLANASILPKAKASVTFMVSEKLKPNRWFTVSEKVYIHAGPLIDGNASLKKIKPPILEAIKHHEPS